MDKRNSKESLVSRIKYLEAQVEALYDAGLWGIDYVGAANYDYREAEARQKVKQAYCNFKIETAPQKKGR